jgi:molybdopterin converting factor small subunit
VATLLFFGPLRDVAGSGSRQLDWPCDVLTITHLIEWLSTDEPDLASALLEPSVQFAVDQCVVARSSNIALDSEIAFLPPMSGG